ncbi:hypothetical protein [Propylenella binzhouense]|uniref:Uncharacterized protein n=1 Tax=Propylenella binzhouense TaxID=2555902 RepID=A0A964T4K1_9HYPH|nr:hypothetical protein [Propylenella binzhouense]MYZ48219.1 hypothetical protein [Propylenella binzhouense]
MPVGPDGEAIAGSDVIRDAGEWASAAHRWIAAIVDGSRSAGAQEIGGGVLVDRIAVPSAFLDAFVDQLGTLASNLNALIAEQVSGDGAPSPHAPAVAGPGGPRPECEIIPFAGR